MSMFFVRKMNFVLKKQQRLCLCRTGTHILQNSQRDCLTVENVFQRMCYSQEITAYSSNAFIWNSKQCDLAWLNHLSGGELPFCVRCGKILGNVVF